MFGLKEVLEAYLVKSLGSGNVVRRALLADECSAENLKTACVSYLAVNKSAFKASELEDLLKKLELAVELLIRVLFHDDEFPAPECLSRKDMVEKRNENILKWLKSATGMNIGDCTFKAGKQRFGCHKCFLMAHSPVLREKPFTKAKTDVVHEELFPVPEAVGALIRYCYDGQTSRIENETVATVFKLAVEYHVDDLKSAMEKRLVEDLNTDNVREMAALAVEMSAQDLMEACGELFAVMESDE